MPINPQILPTTPAGRTADSVAELKRRIAVLERGSSGGVGSGSSTDSNALHRTLFNAKGELISASAPDTAAIVPAPAMDGSADGLRLTINSSTETGLAWESVMGSGTVPLPPYTINAPTPLLSYDANSTTLNELAAVLGTFILDLQSSPLTGTYTSPNHIVDRTLIRDSTTLDELADVLGTLMDDVQAGTSLAFTVTPPVLTPARILDATSTTINTLADVLSTLIEDLGGATSEGVSVASATALPSLPGNGDLFVYEAGVGVSWMLRYRSSTNKWDFLGGPPLRAVVETNQSRTAGGYGDLTTVGPDITIPLAGDYNITAGALCFNGAAGEALMSYAVGAVAALDDDCVGHGGASGYVFAERTRRKTGLAASTLIRAKYRDNGASFVNRSLAITPVSLNAV